MDVTYWDELDYGTQALVQVINNTVSSVTGSPEVIGIVEDLDDEWVLLRTKGKGGKDGTQRLVRISEITKIEELVEK